MFLNLVRRQTDQTGDTTTSWAPNESAYDIWNEKSYLDGVFIGAVAYGVHATLFFITLRLLWSRPRRMLKDWMWIIYICALFTISSIGNGAQLKWAQMIWIDDRNYPGGPSAYLVEGSSNSVPVLSNTCYIINTWFQDGLLLYRFWIIFGSQIWITAFPALVYVTSVALAIVLCVMISQPATTIWSTVAFPVFTSYWSISIGFNALCTIAIVAYLLIVRSKIGKAIAGPYASVSAMLIESAALYTITGIIFIVSYAVASPVQNIVLPTLAQAQSIAPLLIIMRVAQGQAWSAEVAARIHNTTASTSVGFTRGFSGVTDTYADHGVVGRDDSPSPREKKNIEAV